MPSKLTPEQVDKTIKDYPYKVIPGDIVNTYSDIIAVCDKHGKFKTNLKAMRKKHGCFRCGADVRALKTKLTDSDLIKRINEKFKGKIVANPDKSLTCHIHGVFFRDLKKVLTGVGGCLECSKITQGKKITSIEELRKLAFEKGVELLSREYTSYKQKLELRCKEHGVLVKNLGALRVSGCPKCNYKKSAKLRALPKEEAQKRISDLGYELGDDYTRSSAKATFTCRDHGPFIAVVADIFSGHGCPSCGTHKSQPVVDMINMITSLGLTVNKNDRSTIRNPKTGAPLELDILVGDKNLAIEYCGLRWHTTDGFGNKDKNYHYEKLRLCQEKGISLITIFEDEWLNRQDQVKNTIKAKLGLLPKIGARKTRLAEVDKDIASVFLDKWHLQGSCRFVVAFGLFDEANTLLGVATLGRHHRGRSEAVLSRVCFGDVAVVGGPSKLFKAIKFKAKELGFSKLVSWSDNRWSSGGLYKALDMEQQDLLPDYSYVLRQSRMSKQSCTKKTLKKRGGVGATELEMAKSLGYSRIYDCGKKRWVLDLDKSNL